MEKWMIPDPVNGPGATFALPGVVLDPFCCEAEP